MEAANGPPQADTGRASGGPMTKGWLIGGVAFLVLLLVVAVVVAIVEEEESFGDGTPEATVQGFLKAVQDEEFQLAHGFLSQELSEDCTFDQFFSRAGGPGAGSLRYERISLKQTKFQGDRAFVTVRITNFRGSGPFGTSESSHEQTFILSRQDDTWLFSLYPWPFFQCGPYRPPVERIPIERPPVPEPAP